MKRELEVFSEATNAAVIQLPERRFPGVLVQGDTLRSWEITVEKIIEALKDDDLAEARDGAVYLHETLHHQIEHYERVLAKHKIRLPYGI
jgi:hypothetical protein